jgi:hypothetical protein
VDGVVPFGLLELVREQAMSLRRIRPAFGSMAVLAVALMLVISSNGMQNVAAAASPFDGMGGSWSGSGILKLKGGARERLRCKATYNVSGDNLKQELLCASDSYKFSLGSDISHHEGAITGRWTESSRGWSGNVFGRANGTRIDARIESEIFAALVVMTTRGGHQTVTISSPGSELEEVQISLTRTGN